MSTESGDTRYLPPGSELATEEFVLRRLRTDEAATSVFLGEATAVIGNLYDEITLAFAANLADTDRRGCDPNGYFTIGKEVWVARRRATEELLGFEVITRKRGGSVKVGPTLILPSARGEHLATRIIGRLLEEYSRVGARKVYVTAPLSHDALSVIDFRDLGLRLEAVLRSQYREGAWERVSGRLLSIRQDPKVEIDLASLPVELSQLQVKTKIGTDQQPDFLRFVQEEMRKAYADIDDAFASAILAAADRGLDSPYEKKGKLIYCLLHDSKLVGVAVCTPKRGGAVKVAPVLMAGNYRSPMIGKVLIEAITAEFRRREKRKLFFLVPVTSWWLLSFLVEQADCVMEGILREPYKAGVDVAVVSIFLK
jgi:hypothetical protein